MKKERKQTKKPETNFDYTGFEEKAIRDLREGKEMCIRDRVYGGVAAALVSSPAASVWIRGLIS